MLTLIFLLFLTLLTLHYIFSETTVDLNTENILALIFITASGLNTTSAIEIEFENPFTIELSVDSVFTEDGKTYRISASGNAGPYARAYSSWVFTDKLEMGDTGEFSGTA